MAKNRVSIWQPARSKVIINACPSSTFPGASASSPIVKDMGIELIPLPRSHSAHTVSTSLQFGREVKGFDLGNFRDADFRIIEEALYKHDLLLFRDVDLSPEQQYALVKAFDPTSGDYGHGKSFTSKSLLNAYLNRIPRMPQVHVIGHGKVLDHEGIPELNLKHGHHATFHKTRVSLEDEALGATRFFRWHMDAALYEYSPPKVTALYGIRVPTGPAQTVRYDDGTGDELVVSLGTTAFVSGKTMFEILPDTLKNLAVRSKAKYAPHPFEWMRTAHAVSTGLGLETEGLEAPLESLSPWEEAKIKIYPLLWKNPVTEELHLQLHPNAIMELHVECLRNGATRKGVLYPDGAHITDLKVIRDLCQQLQRPGIAPPLVYPHPWNEKDLALFHNRGMMHSVVGVFKEDQIRIFHQCNTAASDDPEGPSEGDIIKWTA